MSNYPYGFIYETTCLVTGMKYRGSHRRTQNPEDPDDSWYLGSSTNPQFWEDLEDYGRINFERKILEDVYVEDTNFLKRRESYYLKEVDARRDPAYYNLTNSAEYGGGAAEGQKLMHRGNIHRYFCKDSIVEALEDGWILGFSHDRAAYNPMKDPEIAKKFSGELNPSKRLGVRKKISENNPMNSLESRKKVAESKKGKVWIHKNEEQSYVSSEDLERYLSEGYELGMLKRSGFSRKDYDCSCRVCGVDYKGGKYSNLCSACYSESMRRNKIYGGKIK